MSKRKQPEPTLKIHDVTYNLMGHRYLNTAGVYDSSTLRTSEGCYAGYGEVFIPGDIHTQIREKTKIDKWGNKSTERTIFRLVNGRITANDENLHRIKNDDIISFAINHDGMHILTEDSYKMFPFTSYEVIQDDRCGDLLYCSGGVVDYEPLEDTKELSLNKINCLGHRQWKNRIGSFPIEIDIRQGVTND